MNFSTSLIVGALLTSAAWLAFWPNEEPQALEAACVNSQAKPGRTILKVDLQSLANESANHREKVEMLNHLESATTSAIKAQLEEWYQMSSADPHHILRDQSRMLLSEWGRRDPEGAVQWSWDRFKNSARWHLAWRQIGPEWAASDPEGFLQYYRSCYRKGERPNSSDIEKSETPLIQPQYPQDYDEWLPKGSLRAAFTYLREKDAFITEKGELSVRSDFQLVDTLQTEQDFLEALGAWDGYHPNTEERPLELPFADRLALSITDKWRKEFPESFSKSRYTAWPILNNEMSETASIDPLKPTVQQKQAKRDREVLKELLAPRSSNSNE